MDELDRFPLQPYKLFTEPFNIHNDKIWPKLDRPIVGELLGGFDFSELEV